MGFRHRVENVELHQRQRVTVTTSVRKEARDINKFHMALFLRAWQASYETKYSLYMLVMFAAQGRAWTSDVVLRM